MSNREHRKPIPGLKPAWRLAGSDRIRHMAWSPDGQTLAVGHLDHSLRLWNTNNGAGRADYAIANAPIIYLAWSADGVYLAAVAEDKAIYIWDVATLKLQQVIQTAAEAVLNFAWSPTGQSLHAAITIGKAPAERLVFQFWDFPGGQVSRVFEDPRWDQCYPAMSPDGQILALALTVGVLEIWDTAAFELVARFNRAFQKIRAVALCKDRERIALALSDATIQIETVKQKRTQRVYGFSGAAYSLDFSCDGRLLAAKSRDGYVHFWKCENLQHVGRLAEPDTGLAEVELKFAPNALRLATYHSQNTGLRIWNIDYEKLRPIHSGEDMITILFLAADPTNSQNPLRVRDELREIEEQLRQSPMRDQFKLHYEPATRPRDISRALLHHRPQVVHFSGHGTLKGEIVLQNNQGGAHPVAPQILGELFERFADQVKCVILNSCYSQLQAEAITRHID